MSKYIGIDLGGTKLLIGQVESDGTVSCVKRYESGYLTQRQALEVILKSLDDYFKTEWNSDQKPVAIGIGVVGRVNANDGKWYQIDISRNEPLNLGQEISNVYGVPCYVDNDVKSATKAELAWGIGKTTNNFVYINIGTGIASGSVLDGVLVRGGNSNAGETGHTTSGVNLGLTCVCGRQDCVELIASGSGMNVCARELRGKYQTRLSIPEDGTPVKVQDIVALQKEGDELCSVLIENASTAISNLIMDQIRSFDPEAVVLGGGVITNDVIFDKVLQKVNDHTARFVTYGITRTTLDPNYAGLMGAAAVALKA